MPPSACSLAYNSQSSKPKRPPYMIKTVSNESAGIKPAHRLNGWISWAWLNSLWAPLAHGGVDAQQAALRTPTQPSYLLWGGNTSLFCHSKWAYKHNSWAWLLCWCRNASSLHCMNRWTCRGVELISLIDVAAVVVFSHRTRLSHDGWLRETYLRNCMRWVRWVCFDQHYI